jgi:hypothetical protein
MVFDIVSSFALKERGGLVTELHIMRTTDSQKDRTENKEMVSALKGFATKMTPRRCVAKTAMLHLCSVKLRG